VNENQNNNDIIKVSYGMRFSPKTNWIAYSLVVIFIIAFATAPDSNSWIITVPFLSLVLLVMATATNGVKFDIPNKNINTISVYLVLVLVNGRNGKDILAL